MHNRETITVLSHATLIHVSTHSRFTGIPCPTQGYKTYLVTIISCTRAYCTETYDQRSNGNYYGIIISINRLYIIEFIEKHFSYEKQNKKKIRNNSAPW